MEAQGGTRLLYRLFVGVGTLMGCAVLLAGAIGYESPNPLRGYLFLILALIASALRLKVPLIVGTLSVNFFFVLLGLLELSFSETLLIACAATAAQVWGHRKQSKSPAPWLFHICNTALAVATAHAVHTAPVFGSWKGTFASLLFAACTLFVMNTLPLAAVVAIEHRKSMAWVWRECNFRLFPYYLVGATVAASFHYSSAMLGGQSPMLMVPFVLLVFIAYQSYLGRVSQQTSQVEAIAALHLRTIEALAMAIEAKDMVSPTHVRRLQLYCVEVGRSLGLPQPEIDALRAAALLHDIGKLAIPDHILAKPGRLTREEFEKVKIHPTVAAEILERVNFPYPVAPVVRHHHEKWNGGGYPAGLKGETIPIGARILAVVDALDVLISDRPYRAAVKMEEALNRLQAEAGLSFDPKIVQLVREISPSLEEQFGAQTHDWMPPVHERDLMDATLFPPKPSEEPPLQRMLGKSAFLETIAAARQEEQALRSLSSQLGNSLHLDETLSGIAIGLRQLVPFETIVIYVRRDTDLIPRYASGECTSLFMSRQIRLGAGIAGWVAEHRKAILNGNPSLEMGATSESMRSTLLNSALVVPLPGSEGAAGVLMVCRRSYEAFDKEHLRVLLALSQKLGSVVENALKYEQAAASASTDFLTGLPNARALHTQLEAELARCRRGNGALTVLVTDLDGFKEVNDRFGHLEGNAVLRAVAKALRECCREYDYVARMGGDEFVILLPGLQEDDVLIKVAQFNRAVVDAGRAVIPDASLGLSVGQARFPDDGDVAEKLLAEADQRMYQAKTLRKLRNSRNGPRGYDFDWLQTSTSAQS